MGTGQDTAALLRECLATDLTKAIFSNYSSEMSKLTEKQLAKTISTCCVTKQMVQTRMSELQKIKQEPDHT